MRLALPTLAQSRRLSRFNFQHRRALFGPLNVREDVGHSRAGKLVCPPASTSRAFTLVTHAASGRLSAGAASSETRGQIRVQHILLNPDEHETAEQLMVSIQGGESFEELARKHSRCPTAANGGEIGWVTQGQLDPAFEQAAFAMQVGGNAVGSVKTRFGLHLVRVLSERPAPVAVQEMSVEDLSVKLLDSAAEGVQLLDVREQHEWDICHLPGFKLYPTSLFREWAPTLLGNLNPTAETIVLCHHGVRSRNVAEWLVRQAGFTEVYNVTGGIDLYARKVEKSLPRY